MTTEDLKGLVGKALGIDPATLSDDSSPASITEWDSMGALEIILILDEATKGSVSADDAAKFTSFGAIAEFLRGKGILAD